MSFYINSEAHLTERGSTEFRSLAAEALASPPLVLRLLSAVASSQDWPRRTSDLVMYVPPSRPIQQMLPFALLTLQPDSTVEAFSDQQLVGPNGQQEQVKRPALTAGLAGVRELQAADLEGLQAASG